MDFLRRILEFFNKANEDYPFGHVNYDNEEEEMVITIHPNPERNAGLQRL